MFELVLRRLSSLCFLFVSSASSFLFISQSGFWQRTRDLLKWFRYLKPFEMGLKVSSGLNMEPFSKMAMVLALVILGIYLFRSTTPQQESSGLSRSTSAYITVAAFLLGALCSGIAGYIGMWVSVPARRSAREALQQIAVRAGGLSAIVVVGMAVIGVAVLYSTFYVFLEVDSRGSMKVTDRKYLQKLALKAIDYIVMLFSLWIVRYLKSADVGADLDGKMEQGIPEDDPRNPAVIADLVGDNVGDCAARGADLFESIAAEIISAMILGGTMAQRCKIEGKG
ncbi:unnamed protein product [Musa textilis]